MQIRPLSFWAIIWSLLLPAASSARVTGICSDCHTMHNSQDDQVLDASGPNPALLNASCAGCHQGTNTNSAGDPPFVFDSTPPVYDLTGTENTTNTLAGGSFYWVQTNDRAGHNVEALSQPDQLLANIPPGGTDLGGRLTCAGTRGCHGSRTESNATADLLGAHHLNDMTVWKDGSTVARSYRFLLSVQGLEDPQYEYRPAAEQHNKYYGKDRTLETDTASGTVSSFCGSCHGDFHRGSGNLVPGSTSFGEGIWIRHPTDFDMGRAQTSSEYDSYNGGTGTANPYSVVSPVATADTGNSVNTSVNITTADGSAIVMCLSCHRAHGSPFDAGLRWNFKAWPGSGTNGCTECHTAKD